ncbi:MAG: stage III sporulation protein AE [Oscillibacter sp.]|nr:stage III sporulation protein AE [Oscillibacter sp.]
MKKWMLCLFAALVLLTIRASAVDLPREVERAMPAEGETLLRGLDLEDGNAFTEGLGRVGQLMAKEVRAVLGQRLGGAAAVLLVVLLCGAVESVWPGDKTSPYIPMAGGATVTLLSAGSIGSLIGLGAETIRVLGKFSTALLPALAAAAAATGAGITASAQRVGTMVLVEVLMRLCGGLLVPLVYCYIALLTASACLPGSRLAPLAEALKKTTVWLLTTALLLFTLYLSTVRIVSGAADAVAVRVAKAAISGTLPVVGGIISEVAETALAGAGMLRSAMGVGGMLAILAACACPFAQLGVQYLLYKLVGLCAAVAGSTALSKLVGGLGGAFGLVLGMAGACALLLFLSVLSFVGVVLP